MIGKTKENWISLKKSDESVWPFSSRIFKKMYFLEKVWRPGFLLLLRLSKVTFSLKKSLKFLSNSSEDWRFSSLILTNFVFFFRFLVTKKLMMSAYKRWCSYFLALAYFKKFVWQKCKANEGRGWVKLTLP